MPGGSCLLAQLPPFYDKIRQKLPPNVTKTPFCVHLYAGQHSIDEVRTTAGRTIYLLNLPYFLAGKIKEYVRWLMEEKGAM